MTHPVNQLGVALFRHVARTPGNLFFSPYSIWACLALARAGAQGQTAEELDALCRFPTDLPEFASALRSKLKPSTVQNSKMITGDDGKISFERTEESAFSMHVANGLFGQEGYPFEAAFLDLLRDAFEAPLESLDYADTDAARERINAWVAEQTQDRIRNIVPSGLPTSTTRMTLANAIHFKAPWQSDFEEHATKPATFRSPGGKVQADMMRSVRHLPYAEDDLAQAVELDYRSGEASMLIVLPKQRDTSQLEAQLSETYLDGTIARLQRTKVALELPRFSFTTPLNLTDVLQKLGAPTPFGEAADFSGIANVPGDPLRIGALLHKAFVDVNEKGTEAAAATVAMVFGGGMPPPETPVPFVADHPFLFAIRHKQAGCTLFLGRLADPSMA